MTGESRRLVGPGPAAGVPQPMLNPYSAAAATPAYAGGAMTPAYGGRTPAIGMTPNPYGARTPAIGMPPNPYGATPNPYGARTPAVGATPNPYGATPNPYGATPNPYGATPNPYGARTPAYAGSATPAYAGAATPAYAGAATPAYAGAVPNPWGAPPAAPAPPALMDGMRMRLVRDARGVSYQRGAYDNATGRLISRNPAVCKVELDAGTLLSDVPVGCVEPLRPTAAGDACIVTQGAWRGSRVTVESIDGNRCRCSMGDGESRDLPLTLLALA